MARLPTFDPARTFDATSLTGSYQDLGSVMGSPVYSFVVYNTSDVDVQLSFDDGTTNGPIIAAGATFAISRAEQMRNLEDASFMLPENAQVQVKQVTGAGTSGNIIFNTVRK